MDAARFVPGAFPGMIWCFTGILVKTSSGRQRYSVLGAVDSHSHELISIRTRENINATSVVALLDAIREKHPGAAISMVMGNARCQRCAAVMEHAAQLGIELLFLPPAAPT